jgi:hypothetical protein
MQNFKKSHDDEEVREGQRRYIAVVALIASSVT